MAKYLSQVQWCTWSASFAACAVCALDKGNPGGARDAAKCNQLQLNCWQHHSVGGLLQGGLRSCAAALSASIFPTYVDHVVQTVNFLPEI